MQNVVSHEQAIEETRLALAGMNASLCKVKGYYDTYQECWDFAYNNVDLFADEGIHGYEKWAGVWIELITRDWFIRGVALGEGVGVRFTSEQACDILESYASQLMISKLDAYDLKLSVDARIAKTTESLKAMYDEYIASLPDRHAKAFKSDYSYSIAMHDIERDAVSLVRYNRYNKTVFYNLIDKPWFIAGVLRHNLSCVRLTAEQIKLLIRRVRMRMFFNLKYPYTLRTTVRFNKAEQRFEVKISRSGHKRYV